VTGTGLDKVFTVTTNRLKGDPPNICHAAYTSDIDTKMHVSANKYRNLYLGSGSRPVEQMVNLDILPGMKPDIVADLERPLPFKDNSFEYIFSYMTLEHINNLLPLAEECWRVMKPNGRFDAHVPWWSSYRTWGDPTHVRAFNTQSFTFWQQKAYDGDAGSTPMGQYRPKCNFEVEHSMLLLNDSTKHMDEEQRNWAVEHYVNVVDEYWIILRAVKEDQDVTDE